MRNLFIVWVYVSQKISEKIQMLASFVMTKRLINEGIGKDIRLVLDIGELEQDANVSLSDSHGKIFCDRNGCNQDTFGYV